MHLCYLKEFCHLKLILCLWRLDYVPIRPKSKIILVLNRRVMSLSVCYSSIKFSVFESFSRGTKSTTVVMQQHNLVLNRKKHGAIHVHKGEVGLTFSMSRRTNYTHYFFCHPGHCSCHRIS